MDEFLAALGAERGGSIDGRTWTCTCGMTASELSERAASVALYVHRKAGHRRVTIEESGCHGMS